jgi:hypothetical protein
MVMTFRSITQGMWNVSARCNLPVSNIKVDSNVSRAIWQLKYNPIRFLAVKFSNALDIPLRREILQSANLIS